MSSKNQSSGSRKKIVIAALGESLPDNIPGFAYLPKEHQAQLCYLIWRYGMPRARHERIGWGEYMTIHYQTLRKHFGKNGFQIINEKLNLFHVTTNWHSKDKQTKGYKPTDKVLAIKQQCMDECARLKNLKMIDSVGKEIKTLPKAIPYRDSKNQPAKVWNDVLIPNVVSINHNGLSAYQCQLELNLAKEKDPEKMAKYQRDKDAAQYLDLLARTALAGFGKIHQSYQESPSGRLYGQDISLQYAPRRIRQAALAGCYMYDIENCHFALLNQQASRLGCNLTAIEHYLNNKPEVRKRIAFDIGLTIDEVKKCLIAIMYGARPTTYPETNALPDTVGVQKAKALLLHPLFDSIYQDVRKARNVILDNTEVTRNRITNLADKKMHTQGKTKEKLLAHMLQGIEALALKTIVTTNPGRIIVLLHDGVVSNQRLEPAAIKNAIKQVTGYDLNISGGLIEQPA